MEKSAFFKYKFFLIMICCNISVCKSQIENRNLFPTPNAASLGMYGQIPVDYFNGLPQINIPLYELKSGSINLPIELSYHAGGIKPADHASWVGLGWTLQAGGAITRIVNDLPDEYIDIESGYMESSGPDLSSKIESNKDGFFYNYAVLGDNNWYSTTLQTEFALLYPSTPVYSSNMGYNMVHRKDKAPDEFAFNFMGMSGSLFMGQDGQWKLKSKQGINFKVSYVTGPYVIQDPNCTFSGSIVYNCLTKFILTGNDGTQYFFGADTISISNASAHRYGFISPVNQRWGLNIKNFLTDDSTAIEFNRINAGGGDAIKGRDGGTVPISWYLTKIKSATGDSMTFQYTRDGFQIINNPAGTFYHYSCPTCTPQNSSGGSVTGSDDQLSILDGVSLTSITALNGSIQFRKSKANILDYHLVGWALPQATLDLFCAYGWELFNGNIFSCGPSEVAAQKSTFLKLDGINIISNNSNLKSFSFNYTENVNNRLFLDAINTKGSDGLNVGTTQFAYNNKTGLANVPYETISIDHWGYYNGINPLCSYFSNSSNCSGTFNVADLLNPAITTYLNNKAPNSNFTQFGILTGITYPTGGNTTFVWEPNTYSKTITQNYSNGFSIVPVDQNNSFVGAGIRIKQINSSAGFNAPTLFKNYLYNRDYIHHTNYLSSGVLNGAIPKYNENYVSSGTFDYSLWTSYNRTPMHATNGSLITYTNVIEQNSDGSMIEYKYSNHDNGYGDRGPISSIYYVYTNFNFQDYRCSSNELERGLLLNENTYNQGFTLLLQKSFQYNNTSSRFSNAVRKYLGVEKFALAGTLYFNEATDTHGSGFFPSNPIFQGADLYALETYIHYPYLQSDTIIQYDQSGLNPSTSITNYTYDNFRNRKTIITTNSKAETILTTNNYAADNITGLSTNAQAGKNALLAAGITGLPLETILTKNNKPVSYNRIDYGVFSTNQFAMPSLTYQSFGAGTPEQKDQYLNYTELGKILESIDRAGIPISYDWGYKMEYPTVKIINAANTLNKSFYTYNTQVANSTSSFLLGAGAPAYNTVISFTQTLAGTITITAPGNLPPSANVSINYTLTGPSNQSGNLCTIGTSGPSCGSTPSTITFTNMPIGSYTLNLSATSSFASYTFNNTIWYSYQGSAIGSTPVGIKEFFYEGFEENTSSNIITGLAHTGSNLWNGGFTVNFIPPSGRNYNIQWWNNINGKWVFNEQPYTPNVVLNGYIDDVRVFPSDAFMTTYTYSPLIGITSQLDPTGKVLFYDYDTNGRLVLIRDQDKNIIKMFCYNYAGQIENCQYTTVSNYTNSAKSGTFIRNNCGSNYTSASLNYTIAAGTYSSYISQADADQMAQNALNANGQAYANINGTCIANVTISGQHNFSCSSTGGTTSGSGIIAGPPGYTTTVTVGASGSSGTFTTTVTLSGGVNLSQSISNGTTSFTFTMPASGSVNWSGSISCANNYGSGSVSAN